MKKKDLDYVARVEKAISKKYGIETIQHPLANWSDEKEEKYLQQIKEIYKKQMMKREATDKIEKEGFLVSKKLLNKGSDRTCAACFKFSFNLADDIYMSKYDCCHECYIKFVDNRQRRWFDLSERVEFLASYYNRGEI
jgi:hypothetical protein